MAEATEKEGAGQKKKVGSIFVWIIATGILFAFYESIILLAVGMFPTGVALALDRSPQKDLARAVGYLNFAGCIPWVVDFWMGDAGLDRVFEIASDPIILSVMYSAAGLGWGMCYVVRPFVGTYLRMSGEFRERQLQKRQEELVDLWGEDVTHEIEEEGDGQEAPAEQAPPAA